MTKFVFGPVPSRRLGFSLGVDVIPRKCCTFDCVYCQVGKTTRKEAERQSFFDPDEIVKQVMEKVKRVPRIDVITLSGSGEPTLNADIGWILSRLKKTGIPLTVITNASLLHRADVRRELKQADILLPSLDAATEAVFERVNRPHASLRLEVMIEGLTALRRDHKGSIWLEIMLMKQMNDDAEQIEKLGKIIDRIMPDKVQLNTVTRPPLEEEAREVGSLELATIAQAMGKHCEVIGTFEKRVGHQDEKGWRESLLAVLRRRSLSFDDIIRTTGVSVLQAKRRLNRMEREGSIKAIPFNDCLFYVVQEDETSL
jgi:wyosine [tRNA(Phe)-imidazoG37] synthetase (radical SAM superfamily)